MSAIFVPKARSGVSEPARAVTALASGVPTSDPRLQSIMQLTLTGKGGYWLVPTSDGTAFTLMQPTATTSLNALGLSGFTSLTLGTPASGSITGATAGTLILVGNAPTGFTINSTARTWAYDGSGTVKSDVLILVEVPATALPNATRISYSLNASAGAALDPSITAPDFTFTSVSTYPPELNFLLDETTVLDQDNLVIQYATDRVFTSPTSTTIPLSTANITGTSPIYTASALASITSPAQTYLRARIERGSTSYSNWSAVRKHGDTTAPAVTTGSSGTFVEQTAIADSWSTTEYVTLALTGTDAALVESTATSGTSGNFRLLANALPDYPTKASYSFNAVFTDDAGNVTTIAKTWTISSLDRTPAAFTFTDVSGASQSTLYTSNSITITSVDAGIDIAASVTNAQYQITRGGTALGWQSAGSFYARLNDVIQLRLTSGTYSTATNAVLTVGGVSDTYTVSVMADPTGVGFTPSSTQPGDYNTGNSASFTFSVDVGVGVYYLYHFAATGTASGTTTASMAGVGSGSNVAGNANGLYSVFAFDNRAGSAGTKSITLTTPSGAYGISCILGGTATGSQITPSSTTNNAVAFTSTPYTGTALTVLSQGLGVFFVFDNPKDGTLSGMTQVAVAGSTKIGTSTTSSTPSVATGTSGNHGIIGLALQK